MIGINYDKPPNKDPVMNQPWFCWCCYAQDKEQKDRLRNTLTRKAATRDAGGVSTLVLALQRSFGKNWEECYVYLLKQSWHWICTTGETCQNYGPGDNFPFMLIYWCWVSTKYIDKYISSMGGMTSPYISTHTLFWSWKIFESTFNAWLKPTSSFPPWPVFFLFLSGVTGES